jgi:peroxiredoxin
MRSIGPACSSTHVPGYISHPKLKEAGQVFVVAVNDPFVYVTHLDQSIEMQSS